MAAGEKKWHSVLRSNHFNLVRTKLDPKGARQNRTHVYYEKQHVCLIFYKSDV